MEMIGVACRFFDWPAPNNPQPRGERAGGWFGGWTKTGAFSNIKTKPGSPSGAS
jgi:hypothetical protein